MDAVLYIPQPCNSTQYVQLPRLVDVVSEVQHRAELPRLTRDMDDVTLHHRILLEVELRSGVHVCVYVLPVAEVVGGVVSVHPHLLCVLREDKEVHRPRPSIGYTPQHPAVHICREQTQRESILSYVTLDGL